MCVAQTLEVWWAMLGMERVLGERVLLFWEFSGLVAILDCGVAFWISGFHVGGLKLEGRYGVSEGWSCCFRFTGLQYGFPGFEFWIC